MIAIALSECTECGGDALVRVIESPDGADVELVEYRCLSGCEFEVALPLAA